MANVKFIRVNGDVPRRGAAADPRGPGRGRPRPAPAAARRRRRRRGGRRRAAAPTRTPATTRRRQQLAAWMGREAEKRGLPKELPVMASLVESGVKNLNFGDADSVGFFQMRVGIWNQGEYAGFPEKPELQVKWFLDQAEAVKKQRIAARPVRHRPEPVRRLDRRRRAPRRAVPRPLRAAPRRGQRPARPRPATAPAAPAAAAAAAAAARARPPRRTAAAAPPRRRRPGESGQFMAAKAEAASAAGGGKAGSGIVHGRPGARRAGERGGGARRRSRAWSTPPPRRPRRRRARQHARRRGPQGRADASSACTRRASTPAPRSTSTSRRRSVGAGQPVVRELRDVVARAGRPQDGRQRLGRGADVGPQRRGEQERPPDRQRRPGAPRRHRRLRLGPPGRLRLRRPHRLPRQRRQGRQVHRARGQQPGPGHEGPARRRARRNVKFIRIGGDAPPRRAAAPGARRRRRRGRRRRGGAARRRRRRYPGDNASKAQLAALAGPRGREARAPASSCR